MYPKQPEAFRLIDELENAAMGFYETGSVKRCQSAKKALRAHIDAKDTRISALEAVGAGGVEPLRKRECLHQISEPAQPVAWAIFAENGHVRMWTQSRQHAEAAAKDIGLQVTPLYAAPQPAAPALDAEPCRCTNPWAHDQCTDAPGCKVKKKLSRASHPPYAAINHPAAANSGAEPVARIEGIDEYGPRLEWMQHWVDVGVGAKLFTAAQVQAMLAAMPRNALPPEPTSTAAAEVAAPALDAARYQFLRDGEWRDTELEPFIRLQLNALWDAKIDAAIAAKKGKKP